MKNRKDLPVEIKSRKLKRDELIFRRRKHLLAIKWEDVRDVIYSDNKT